MKTYSQHARWDDSSPSFANWMTLTHMGVFWNWGTLNQRVSLLKWVIPRTQNIHELKELEISSMIPKLYMKKGCPTKHPLTIDCLGLRALGSRFWSGFFRVVRHEWRKSLIDICHLRFHDMNGLFCMAAMKTFDIQRICNLSPRNHSEWSRFPVCNCSWCFLACLPGWWLNQLANTRSEKYVHQMKNKNIFEAITEFRISFRNGLFSSTSAREAEHSCATQCIKTSTKSAAVGTKRYVKITGFCLTQIAQTRKRPLHMVSKTPGTEFRHSWNPPGSISCLWQLGLNMAGIELSEAHHRDEFKSSSRKTGSPSA